MRLIRGSLLRSSTRPNLRCIERPKSSQGDFHKVTLGKQHTTKAWLADSEPIQAPQQQKQGSRQISMYGVEYMHQALA